MAVAFQLSKPTVFLARKIKRKYREQMYFGAITLQPV